MLPSFEMLTSLLQIVFVNFGTERECILCMLDRDWFIEWLLINWYHAGFRLL